MTFQPIKLGNYTHSLQDLKRRNTEMTLHETKMFIDGNKEHHANGYAICLGTAKACSAEQLLSTL